MWDYLAPLTAIVLALVLAVVGIFPSLQAGRAKRWTVGAVIIAVGANVGMSILSVQSAHESQDQVINSMTGGDSYPFIMPEFSGFKPEQNEIIILGLQNMGDYTLYELKVTILDQDKFEGLLQLSKDIPNDIVRIHNDAQNIFNIGNIGAHQMTPYLTSYAIDPTIGKRNLLVEMYARNGYVRELIGLRWINNHWSFAYDATNSKGTQKKFVSKDYPKDANFP